MSSSSLRLVSMVLLALAAGAPASAADPLQDGELHIDIEMRRLKEELRKAAHERASTDAPFKTSIRFDASVPPDVRELVLGDLSELAAIRGRGGSPLHEKIFGGGVDGRVYMRWLEERVEVVRLGSCPGAAYACYYGGPKTITLMDLASLRGGSVRSTNVWERLTSLIHEARHRDGLHEPCEASELVSPKPDWDRLGVPPAGRVNGRFACDREADGAYGTAVVFLANVRDRCGDCAPGETERSLMSSEIEFQSSWVVGEKARRALNADLASPR